MLYRTISVFHGNSVLTFLLKEQGFDKFVAVVAVVADVSLVTVASQVQAFCALRKVPRVLRVRSRYKLFYYFSAETSPTLFHAMRQCPIQGSLHRLSGGVNISCLYDLEYRRLVLLV